MATIKTVTGEEAEIIEAKIQRTNRLLNELNIARMNGDVEQANRVLLKMKGDKSFSQSTQDYEPSILDFKTEILNCRKVIDNAYKKVVLYHGLMDNFCKSEVDTINEKLQNSTRDTLKNLSSMSKNMQVTLDGLREFEKIRSLKIDKQMEELQTLMNSISDPTISKEEADCRVTKSFELRKKLGK